MTTAIASPEEFGPILQSVEAQLRDMDYEPVLKQASQDLAEYEAGMFAGEFDSNLSPWAPLKESTIKKKGHDRILFETGALRESLVSLGGAGNINATDRRGLLFGTEVEYAGFLHDGTSRMPARPPVGMSEETLDKLTNRIADETVRQLTVSGGN